MVATTGEMVVGAGDVVTMNPRAGHVHGRPGAVR
jgi:hypothetical protein